MIRFSLLFILFFTPGLLAQDFSDLKEVTLQLKWKHQFQFAGYYAAIEQGFYEDEGLKVNLLEADGNREPASVVFDGDAEFGITTSDILLLRSQGHDAVLMASIFQHSAQILVAAQNSGIEHAQHLVGKRIALEAHAADILTYLNDEGVTMEDLDIFPHGFSANSLINGEVDALTAYISDEPFFLREQGFDFVIIDPSMGGIDFYGDVLFTTGELVRNDPELVERFRRASIMGWEYAMSNPDELIDIIFEKYTQRHSREHLKFEADRMRDLIMDDVVEIGYSNPGRWSRILEIYEEQNLLASRIDLSGFFLEDYLNPSTPSFPWKLFTIWGVVLLGITSATVFYYNTNRKLKKEAERRIQTQKRLVESERKLKESNAAKDKFFSILAHDLRNPFTAILGLTELVMLDVEGLENKELKDNLVLVKDATLHTSELLNNLLAWSKSQVGSIEYNPEVLNLAELVEKNVRIVNGHAVHKNVDVQLDTKRMPMVFGDKNMINTILLNLLTNAIKFSYEEGSISIEVETQDSHALISITDHGVGIQQENIDKLFNIDMKFTKEGTASEKGSGLGLILCKEFVEKQGGEIWVESTYGAGSTFKFTLPLLTNASIQ